MEQSIKQIRRESNINAAVILLFFVIAFSLSILSQVVLIFTVKDTEMQAEIQFLVGLSLQYLVAAPIAIRISKAFRKDRYIPLKTGFTRPQVKKGTIVRWIIISLFLTYAANFLTLAVTALIHTLTGVQIGQADLSSSGTTISIISTITGFIFLAPFFEELLFRGVVFRQIARFGGWLPVIFSGIIFGLFHMNFPQILFAGVLGSCSAFLFLKTKSIIPAIILHLILNTIGGLVTVFAGVIDLEKIAANDMEYAMENAGLVLGYAGIVVLLLGLLLVGFILFILEIILHRDSFHLDNNCPEIPLGKRIAALLFAPLNIVMFLFFIAFTAATMFIPAVFTGSA
jgi:membrane protease YdiL (CAAX protease family)